jgi:hypothetical protein
LAVIERSTAKPKITIAASEKLDIAGSKETALVRPSVSLRLVGHVLKVDDGTIRYTVSALPGQSPGRIIN